MLWVLKQKPYTGLLFIGNILITYDETFKDGMIVALGEVFTVFIRMTGIFFLRIQNCKENIMQLIRTFSCSCGRVDNP